MTSSYGESALIIKTGALGDVLRTTPILEPLKSEGYSITWATSTKAIPLVPEQSCTPISPDKWKSLLKRRFKLILSLDEDAESVRLASHFKDRHLVHEFHGVYFGSSGEQYTGSSAEWYDMSLISKLGRDRADELKWKNKSSYQEILFRMLGKKFIGEHYQLSDRLRDSLTILDPPDNLICIEGRAGSRWPTKVWNGFLKIIQSRDLQDIGFRFKLLRHRPTLSEYANDINKARILLSGDTLAMHLGMALWIPTVALFTCTSPNEIHGYDSLVKIVSPKLKNAFYCRDLVPEAIDAISSRMVTMALLRKLLFL